MGSNKCVFPTGGRALSNNGTESYCRCETCISTWSRRVFSVGGLIVSVVYCFTSFVSVDLVFLTIRLSFGGLAPRESVLYEEFCSCLKTVE